MLKQRIVIALAMSLPAVAHAEPDMGFTGEAAAYIGGVNLGRHLLGSFDVALGMRIDRVDILFESRAGVVNSTGVDGWYTTGTSLHVFVVPTVYVLGGMGLTLSAMSHAGDSPLAGPQAGFEGTLGVGVRLIGTRHHGIDARVLGNVDTAVHNYPTLWSGSVGLAAVF